MATLGSQVANYVFAGKFLTKNDNRRINQFLDGLGEWVIYDHPPWFDIIFGQILVQLLVHCWYNQTHTNHVFIKYVLNSAESILLLIFGAHVIRSQFSTHAQINDVK